MDHADGITAFPHSATSHARAYGFISAVRLIEVDTAYYHTHPKLPEIIAFSSGLKKMTKPQL
eukprot:4137004-Prymnesium_polylepis.1